MGGHICSPLSCANLFFVTIELDQSIHPLVDLQFRSEGNERRASSFSKEDNTHPPPTPAPHSPVPPQQTPFKTASKTR